MSFNHTKTPTKGSSGRKQRYVVPTRRGKYGAMEYYFTPELEAEFRRLYPITLNPVLMDWFGISFSTMQRFKREMGLEKNRKIILKKHAAQVKKICKKNGYYDSLKGKAPSPQCHEAYQRKRAEGFSSIRALKENNPRGYRAYLKRKSKARAEVWRIEHRRVELGLSQKTGLLCPQFAYSRRQVGQRSSAKRRGYILGDMRENMGERYTIYYDEGTERSERFEQSLKRLGHFDVEPLPAEPKPRRRHEDMTQQTAYCL